MRLTADLISRSPQVINAVKDRELILRGNKIPAIENLGATLDQFDSLDVSDNDIKKLDGFPRLNRLKCLLACNNRIARIGQNLNEFLPKLETLALTNNHLSNLADLEPLASLTSLLRLSLLDNPVTKRQHYRLYVIHKIPSIKLLDFARVKLREREASRRLFGGAAGKALKESIAPPKTFVPGEGIKPQKTGPTPEEIAGIKLAIQNATSLEEVQKLEKALKSGNIPPDLLRPKISQNENGPSDETTPAAEGTDAPPADQPIKDAKPASSDADAAAEDSESTAPPPDRMDETS